MYLLCTHTSINNLNYISNKIPYVKKSMNWNYLELDFAPVVENFCLFDVKFEIYENVVIRGYKLWVLCDEKYKTKIYCFE